MHVLHSQKLGTEVAPQATLAEIVGAYVDSVSESEMQVTLTQRDMLHAVLFELTSSVSEEDLKHYDQVHSLYSSNSGASKM